MFQHIVTAWRIDRGCSRMLEHAKPDLIQQPSLWLLQHRCSRYICYFIIPWQQCSIMYEHGCWFIMMVRTTLFKYVRSSRHGQSVPLHARTSLSINNTVQAGQLNHVQACQAVNTHQVTLCINSIPSILLCESYKQTICLTALTHVVRWFTFKQTPL